MIMAAGTGGHVFPALSIAETFLARGVNVEWLGTPTGMENAILEDTKIPLHQVTVKGLRGAGLVRLLLAPVMLLRAFYESFRVLRRVNPDCVIGMGGFVCGPAGLACKLQGRPLFIHEQNAVAGLTNKILARLANKVFEAFPNTFPESNKILHTGNPLRDSIKRLAIPDQSLKSDNEPMRLLILGGSQGAQAINRLVPIVVSKLNKNRQVLSLHQSGQRDFDATLAHYESAGLAISEENRLTPFVHEMAEAFAWADLVVCRSGASTVSEIAAMGLPAIFVPYPYHKDQQQTHNANWLASKKAAIVVQQKDLSEDSLLELLRNFEVNRSELRAMGDKARSLAILNADQEIVDSCLEVIRG